MLPEKKTDSHESQSVLATLLCCFPGLFKGEPPKYSQIQSAPTITSSSQTATEVPPNTSLGQMQQATTEIKGSNQTIQFRAT